MKILIVIQELGKCIRQSLLVPLAILHQVNNSSSIRTIYLDILLIVDSNLSLLGNEIITSLFLNIS
jgi:hypothetical protein